MTKPPPAAPSTVGERWREYLSTCIPAEASEVEIMQARRAFYAGCAAALGILGVAGSAATSEDDGGRIIARLLNELETFARIDPSPRCPGS